MAELPKSTRYRPAPQSNRPIVGYDGAAMGRALEKSGEGIRKSGEDKYQAATRFEYERAKSHLLISSIEAENELENDQDFGTYEERYGTRMTKARDDAAKLLTDPAMREMFAIESDEMMARGMAGIKGKVKRKEIDFGRATLDEQLDQNTQFALQTTDPEKRRQLIAASDGLIEGAFSRGYLGAEEGVLKRRKYSEDFGKNWVALQDPDKVAELLQHDILKPEPHMGKLYQVESRGNPDAKNPTSSATGLGQFLKGTAKQYGLKDPRNPIENDRASRAMWEDNRTYLTNKLGREPTDGELYLAHQQGGAGALQLLRDPNQLAIDAVGAEEVMKNLPKSQQARASTITAGEFAELWTKKYDEAEPVSEVKAFRRTGTPIDYLPYEEKIALLGKLPAMQKAAREAKQTAVLDAVLPIVQENNGDYNTIPKDLQDKAKALGLWDKVTQYKGVSDTDALIDLNTMSPDALLQVDFKSPEWRTKLSRDDIEKFAAKQGEIQNKPEEKALMRSRDEMVKGEFEKLKIDLKKDKAKAQLSHFQDLLSDEILVFKARSKRDPDNTELQAMINGLMKRKAVTGISIFGVKETAAYDMTLDDVPDADRNAIVRDLRAAGRNVTDGAILRLYILKQQRKE